MSGKVQRLDVKSVQKPWGRTDLPSHFGRTNDMPIGEIWFVGPETMQLPILVKYLFTSARLSVQVHPDDDQARHVGLTGGKSECWYILDAEPGATIGIGLNSRMHEAELRAAALDGRLEELIDWKPVSAGNFYYIPARTIHAIGGGIKLIEVQQNNDVTYRIYDYGRPRSLHLDEALKVARLEPYCLPERRLSSDQSEPLVGGIGSPFILDSIALRRGETRTLEGGPIWLVPIYGSGTINGVPWSAGECWLIESGAAIAANGDAYLFAARTNPTST
ncbi:class I mannose-6-phosphate isomerase [Sphingobium sp. TCM1]|uniref:class I mannose-6-phosphate isomerase n=1 Tax=Sphingobium sp. TCM1 TaxID=453246 RepID=UPI0007F40481|nr:class I mannose-6-phosphate isomerase [Sphingobium sp. TCM1]OAN54821.1 phosphoheptose isomerase [Sphingobium sp. TCM1]